MKVVKFSTNEHRTIIFQSYDMKNDPSPYQVKFQGKTSAGTHKKMVVSTSISTGPERRSRSK